MRFARVILLAIITTFAVMFTSPAHAAETVTYTYDALGRLTSVTYSNGATVTYTYDAAGNRTAVVTTTPTLVIVVPLMGYTVIAKPGS